jgi:three-Cys-motif partner protein
MTINPNKFLLQEDDGLPTRAGRAYTPRKLKLISEYMDLFNQVTKDNPWIERFYIDLQAGPGKNRVGDQIVLGSPLLALTIEHPFTQYIFNEQDPMLYAALEQRVSVSPLRDRIKLYKGDVNQVVSQVCKELVECDTRAKLRRKWSTMNLAFLDPNGLELHWSTVSQLARMKKMDLIINFSTMGLTRNIDWAIEQEGVTAVDRFFGNQAWRDLYNPTINTTAQRRQWIDYYTKRLEIFKYKRVGETGGSEVVFKNSRNAQVYSLIFASKHELGTKLWKIASKSSTPRLFE